MQRMIFNVIGSKVGYWARFKKNLTTNRKVVKIDLNSRRCGDVCGPTEVTEKQDVQ